jgi:hypothetical protein
MGRSIRGAMGRLRMGAEADGTRGEKVCKTHNMGANIRRIARMQQVQYCRLVLDT